MNEDRLENLLKEKKDQVFHFNRSEEEFFAGFIAETKCREAQKIHIWRYAAIFAAVLGLAVLAVISMRNYPLPASETTKPVSMATNKAPARSFDPMQESLRLFGDDVAVLFVDIRGFTPMSENLTPEEVVSILNEYLALTTNAILTNEGTLDKFIGDATMAVFNAPFDLDDYIYRAILTALAIRDGSDKLAEELQRRLSIYEK